MYVDVDRYTYIAFKTTKMIRVTFALIYCDLIVKMFSILQIKLLIYQLQKIMQNCQSSLRKNQRALPSINIKWDY